MVDVEADPRDGGNSRNFLVGNSSAGLIEAGAIGVGVVNIGDRQSQRERGSNVTDARETTDSITAAIAEASQCDATAIYHPYGDGRAGELISGHLKSVSLADASLLRKRWAVLH